MTAVTLQDVSAWTERESVYWYIGAAFRSARRHLALVLLVPPLFIAVIVLAQFYPFRMRTAMSKLRDALPTVSDLETLTMTRDVLKLAYQTGRFYNHFCLAKSVMITTLEEIDETVDSLEFVLANHDELKSFVDSCSKSGSPDLPLPFASKAVNC